MKTAAEIQEEKELLYAAHLELLEDESFEDGFAKLLGGR